MDDSVPPNTESAAETEGWSDPASPDVGFRSSPTRQNPGCEEQGLPVYRHKNLCEGDKNVK